MQGLIVNAQVVDTQDPDQLGRVKVKMLGYAVAPEVWLRMLSPYATQGAGIAFLPEVGDEVLVLRGAGDSVDGMVILGALYNGANQSPVTNPDGKDDTKLIRTRSGNQLEFSDTEHETSVSLQTAGGNKAVITDKAGAIGLTFGSGDGVIALSMDSSGVTLRVANGRGLAIRTDGDVTLAAAGNAKVTAMQNVSVEGKMGVSIKGSTDVTIESTAGVTVKGSAQVQVQAPMVKIAGGLVQLG